MLAPLRSREQAEDVEPEVDGMKGRLADMLPAADMLLRKLLDWAGAELCLCRLLDTAAEGTLLY